MKRLSFLFILIVVCFTVDAQKKSVEAYSISTPLTIDGILDEPAYQLAQPAKDFIQLAPYNGNPSFQPSEVRFFYDQTAIYVGAMLYDSHPDSIFNYLTARDNIGMADYFGVYFDPYNKGQLAYGFFINPAGVQTDIKAIKGEHDEEDGNWDAVWESKTRITDKGWIVEMRIPYSALRFPDQEIHVWGLNMFRNIRRYNSNNSWSMIDRNVMGFIHQQGELTGIKNITPPVRLTFTPYAATYLEYKDGSSSPDFIYKGGLDLKYGINESYTLDMMVIPDFGQIQSDDERLNLSPYEVYYDERRQFFTEGVELFNRGNIFYSRRIGTNPKFGDRADDAIDNSKNEIIDDRPSETQLVNATKISGRNTQGLAIGFLNAMSLQSHATLRDTITGQTREVLIQPFTNYNVSVLDQSLKNNSYISLINTNMWMSNDPFMANVTATEFQIRDKSKTYAISGKGGVSHRGSDETETGWFGKVDLTKNSGKLHYGIGQEIYSDKYNPNDMGYLRRNNEMETEVWINHRLVNPFWIFREFHSNLWWEYARVINPSDFFGQEIGFFTYGLFKNNYGMEMNGGWESEKNDYYEPRVDGRYFYNPDSWWGNLELHTDRRNALNFYFHVGGFERPDFTEYSIWTHVGINWRLGQHLQLEYDFESNQHINDRGYIEKSEANDTIWFARRDIDMLENRLEIKYAFNNALSLRLRGRHNWAMVDRKEYYTLNTDGSLKTDPEYSENQDENNNWFNVDLILRWVFAPGSEMTFGWKNTIYTNGEDIKANYWNNLKNTWNTPQTNTFSLKVLYYIDYNNLKCKTKG